MAKETYSFETLLVTFKHHYNYWDQKMF